MKRAAALILSATVLFAACGDDAAADTCEQVAEDTVDLVQDLVDLFEAMSPSEAGAVMEDGSPELTALGERGAAIGTRGEALACTDLDAMVAERASRLTYDPANGFTALIVESTRAGEDVMARLFR